jgi:rare lipoprotein A
MRFALVYGLFLVCASTLHAETMVTSHYRAKSAQCAAHKRLPIGTLLRVTNLKNGRSAIVRICGRGPFIRGRHLDISDTMAHALGFGNSGVLRLKTQVMRD